MGVGVVVGWSRGGGVLAHVIIVSPQSQLDLDFDLGLIWVWFWV